MSPVPLFTICKSILTQVLFNSLDNCSAKCHRCNVIKAGSINSHRKKFCNYGLISSSSLATRHNPNKFGFCSRCSFGLRCVIFWILFGSYRELTQSRCPHSSLDKLTLRSTRQIENLTNRICRPHLNSSHEEAQLPESASSTLLVSRLNTPRESAQRPS